MKKGDNYTTLSNHALNSFLGYCERPTPVGQPALGLAPASILNDNINVMNFLNLVGTIKIGFNYE